MTDTRLPHSCNNFVDSGQIFEPTLSRICETCRWVDSTHHPWQRMFFPSEILGPGWQCKRCGRSAYDKDGRCTPESPPTDYPACGTWWSNS